MVLNRRHVMCDPLVDHQRAPHCGEQLEEALQEEARGRKAHMQRKTFRISATLNWEKATGVSGDLHR